MFALDNFSPLCKTDENFQHSKIGNDDRRNPHPSPANKAFKGVSEGKN
jgi:hypothetical protein